MFKYIKFQIKQNNTQIFSSLTNVVKNFMNSIDTSMKSSDMAHDSACRFMNISYGDCLTQYLNNRVADLRLLAGPMTEKRRAPAPLMSAWVYKQLAGKTC